MAKHPARLSVTFPILLTLVLLAVLAAPFGAQPLWAAEGHAPEGHAGESPSPETAAEMPREAPTGPGADPGHSPWEHQLGHNATTMMRIYLCDHARRPPSWCGEPRDLPANAELPEPQGPPLHEDDARWLAFLDQADPSNLSQEDVATIRLRAIKRRDPQAMEILGFLYAEGISVPRDYAESYRWYGLAYLAGESRVRANMDVVWQQLQRTDLEAALALTREFDDLAAGEVPQSLVQEAAEASAAADSNAESAPGDAESAAH